MRISAREACVKPPFTRDIKIFFLCFAPCTATSMILRSFEASTRKKLVLEELPNSSETDDMRKIR